jgi:circadian clock protein KaiB
LTTSITIPRSAGSGVVQLRLYVAGKGPKSLAALSDLKAFCAQHLKSEYEIEVIDLIESPEMAQGDEIVAIPTLVRRSTQLYKLTGDLSNTERVLVGLDLKANRSKE